MLLGSTLPLPGGFSSPFSLDSGAAVTLAPDSLASSSAKSAWISFFGSFVRGEMTFLWAMGTLPGLAGSSVATGSAAGTSGAGSVDTAAAGSSLSLSLSAVLAANVCTASSTSWSSATAGSCAACGGSATAAGSATGCSGSGIGLVATAVESSIAVVAGGGVASSV